MVNPNQVDMEVLKKIALGYFARSTTEEKQLVHERFDRIDADGNKGITLAEFLKPLNGVEGVNVKEIEQLEKLFKYMDTNGDGTLDFNEFLTFFYMTMSGGVLFCYGCSRILVNVHFSCLVCHFMKSGNSYDLCSDCYRRGNFSHPHSKFLDSLTLLRLHRSNWTGQSLNNSEDSSGVRNVEITSQSRSVFTKIAKIGLDIAMELGLGVNSGDIQMDSCTIM